MGLRLASLMNTKGKIDILTNHLLKWKEEKGWRFGPKGVEHGRGGYASYVGIQKKMIIFIIDKF